MYSDKEITVWLEQYKQRGDDIRNYRAIHWQIATMLFALMVGIIGFGMTNVEGNCGKFWVCLSASLIFLLHITTYCYFKKIEGFKEKDQKAILNQIGLINGKICVFEDKHRPMFFFWDHHPIAGFIFIGLALIFLARALWTFPKNPQHDTQNATINNMQSQANTQCLPTNHIEIFVTPNNVKVNPQVSVTAKKDQKQHNLTR